MSGLQTWRIVRADAQHSDALVKFNAALASETEDKQLDPTILRRGVQAILDDANKGFYSVALSDDGTVAGSLLITYEWSDWRNGWFWWIQSVYVPTAFRRQGVYPALYDHVQTMARDAKDVYGFRLYVEVENTRAQETYRRQGMHECAYRMYEAPLSS